MPLRSTRMNRKRSNRTPAKKQRLPTSRSNNQRSSLQVSREFIGPVPPPDLLERYNQIIPGAGERIIAMAEQETSHRHDIERTIVTNEYREAKRGQIFAVIIGSLAIISGTIISLQGAQWAGIAIGGGGVIGLVSVFIFGRQIFGRQEESK